jgi:hypothetical protein
MGCLILGEMLLARYKQLARGIKTSLSTGSGSSSGDSPAAAAQDLAVLAPLAAAVLRGFYQLQASGSTSSSMRNLGSDLQERLAVAPYNIVSLFLVAVSAAFGTRDLQALDGLPQLLVAAPEVPWLMAVALATTTAAAHENAGSKAPFAPPAAVGSSSGGRASSSSNSSSRGHSSCSSSSSRRQGSAVPPHHAQLLAALGVPAPLAAHVSDKAGPMTASTLLICLSTLSSICLSPKAHGSSSSIPPLDMLLLDAHQVACICATAAELVVLLPSASMTKYVAALSTWEAAAAMSLRSSSGGSSSSSGGSTDAAAAAAASSDAARMDPVPDVLSLVVQLVIPAALHLAAQAADPAAASRAAWDGVRGAFSSALQRNRSAGDSVFDGAAFQQHPAAVLAAFEAVTRVAGATDDGQPFIATLQAQALSSSSLRARMAAAATDPGPAQALLYLLTSCAKGVAADWSHQAAGNPAAAAHDGAVCTVATALLVMMTAQHAQLSITQGGKASGSSSSSADLQPLVWGFGHVMGKVLYTAGAVLSAALPADASSSPEEAMAAAAALPWGTKQQSRGGTTLLTSLRKLSCEQVLPAGCAGWTQQQLQECFSTLESALAAVLSVCARLAEQAPEAEAALAAAEAAGDTQGAKAASGPNMVVSNAQLQLLLATHAEGRRLADAFTSLGSALCAALPTKFACNHPACASCDQLSEQQLVGGKGSVCSGCRVARFCCVEHHHRRWKAHKGACRALAAAAGAGAGAGGGSSSGAGARSSSGGGKAKTKRAQA